MDAMDADAASKYELKFEGHASYLNPQWSDGMSAEPGPGPEETGSEGLSHNLQSLVTTELNSYIQNHVQFYREALLESGHNEGDGDVLLELDATQEAIIQKHAETNFSYCKQLLHYLIKAHVEDDQTLHLAKLHEVLEEYFEYAPGPWREAALVEVLTTSILPRCLRNLKKKETEMASSSSSGAADRTVSSIDVSAADDDMNGSIISSSDGVTDDFSETASLLSLPNLSRNDQHKVGIKLKKAITTVNRLKAEIAMLRESLDNSRSHDVTLLQDKLRGAHSDLIAVRRRNTELKDRVQTLEATVFQALRPGTNADADARTDATPVDGEYDNADNASDDIDIDIVGSGGEEFQDAFRNKTERNVGSNSKNSGSANGKRIVSKARGIAAQAQAQARDKSTGSTHSNSGSSAAYGNTPPPTTTDELVGTNAWLQARQAKTSQVQVNTLQKQVAAYERQVNRMQAEMNALAEAAASSSLSTSATANQNKTSIISSEISTTDNGSISVIDTKALEKAPLSKLLSALPAVVSKDHRRLIDSAAQEALQASKEVDRRTIEAMVKETDRLMELLEIAQKASTDGTMHAEANRDRDTNSLSDDDTVDTGVDMNTQGSELDTETSTFRVTSSSDRKKTMQRASPVYGAGSIILAILVGFMLSLVVPLLRSLRGQRPY